MRLSSDQRAGWLVDLSFPAQPDRSVLVVDNSADFIRLVQRYLAGSGWEVVGAQDVDRAFALVARIAPRVILLDVVMPHRDGWDLLLSLKSAEATSRIPVVICSVLEEPDVALPLGASATLQKPIGQRQLIDTLDAWA